MQRIQKPRDYSVVFKSRKMHTSNSFSVHYTKDTVFRYGIIVSKTVGNSVVRHRKYRQFREIIRKISSGSYCFAVVIRVKQAAVEKTFWELLNELTLVFGRIEKEFLL